MLFTNLLYTFTLYMFVNTWLYLFLFLCVLSLCTDCSSFIYYTTTIILPCTITGNKTVAVSISTCNLSSIVHLSPCDCLQHIAIHQVLYSTCILGDSLQYDAISPQHPNRSRKIRKIQKIRKLLHLLPTDNLCNGYLPRIDNPRSVV